MLKDIGFSLGQRFSTTEKDNPMSFHLDCLSNSTQLDLLLGYFSSSAISMLSLGFATFLYNGGKVRMAINHILSSSDREAFIKGTSGDIMEGIIDLSDIKGISEKLDAYDRHFFECIAWLIANKKIEFVIIQPKEGNGIAHYKEGIYYDENDQVGFNGSMNFTANGLAGNLESLECLCSWLNGDNEKLKIKKKFIDNILEERDNKIDYLDVSQVIENINDEFGGKDLRELLEVEKELLKAKREALSKNEKLTQKIQNLEEIIEYYDNMPRFPYPSGPRDYQIEAYNKWVENGKQGLFAMATGTGKTLTALNCILQEYNEKSYYKFLVLVPTTALAKQWVEEASRKFKFQNIILCCSENANWKDDLSRIGKGILFGRNGDYGIITTYASFKGVRFQTILQDYFVSDYDKITLIADEAHNLGSLGVLKVIPNFITKRIGLSATPERQFDEEGNKVLNNYFSCTEDEYTFEYDMKKAIENKVLCRYNYYPVLVHLEHDEQEQYLVLSKELSKFIDPETGKYRESEFVNNLLIKRKNIIHKAKNKLAALLSIIEKIGVDNFKKAFIYVPEGIDVDYSESDLIPLELENVVSKLIDSYINEIYANFKLRMAKFTGETKNRDEILKQFKEGKLDVLLAMKCLDEGVDVPQTQYAIFCSSTGNPRQYIQRRGRVLRMHEDKEYAIIYDLIVKPTIDYTNTDEFSLKVEKNIFYSELKRLVNFAVLSENKEESLRYLEVLCSDMNIDIYELANNELNKYK